MSESMVSSFDRDGRASFDRDGREKRIAVKLSSNVYVFTVEGATKLRDELTRELGAPQALSPGEAIVWATAYAAKRDFGRSVVEAIRLAAIEVKNLRSAQVHAELLGDDRDAADMLAAMTGGGR